MREIPLRNRKGDVIAFALVDDADYEWLTQWKWHRSHHGYPVRSSGSDKIYMYKCILGVDSQTEVDHKNRNRLDNQRNNLRICTRRQNTCNTTKHGGASKYKGVTWHKANSKWQVQIVTPEKRIYLGCFESEIEAAQVYNAAARIHHGEFAHLNEV